jgi:hypothetical protein
MERLEILLALLDESLDTTRKRHIVGGVLMSVSLFFGGLAITIFTINREEREDNYE